MTATDRPYAPAEALRWYARRENVGDSPEGRAWAEQLRRWADELDAAPTTYQLPPEPGPEVTELWDRDGDHWERRNGGRDGLWWHEGVSRYPVDWYGLLSYGPLSTTPPTEETADA